MFNSTTLLLIIAVILIGISLLRRIRVIRLQYQQRLGLRWLLALGGFLSHVQQHRGLTNGYLSGGDALKADIPPLQKNILSDIDGIEAIGPWITANDRWQSILDHWSRLARSYADKSAEGNLSEHNQLVRNILYLIDDMAQTHGLLHFNGLATLWRELLTTTEYIGQARAIGTGIAATGYCGSVARIRLNYLCEKIGRYTNLLCNELELEPSRRIPVDSLIECIEKQIAGDRVVISPKEFFDTATRAIDGLSSQYTRKIEQNCLVLTGR